MTRVATTHRVAMIGCGGFGSFAIRAYQELPNVEVVALAGSNAGRAQAAAQRLGVPRAFDDYRRMLDEVECDLVAILTPPHLHCEQFIECAHRGKHLICEKPLALTLADADAMIAAAREANVVATVNHMMRYSPLIQQLKALSASGKLGAIKHLSFHNHAGAAALSDEHWFWDEQRSGGILVEHGVHFYDLFAWLLGQPAEPIATRSPQRGEVWSVVAFPGSRITADFYHHFDRNFVGEENWGAILFEQGFVRFEGWIPLRLTIDEAGGPDQTTSVNEDKEVHYAGLLRHVMRDVLARIADPDHDLLITLADGRAALATALRATAITRGADPGPQ